MHCFRTGECCDTSAILAAADEITVRRYDCKNPLTITGSS